MVSITTLVPFATLRSDVICDCMSVGNPGYGWVFMSTGETLFPLTLTDVSSSDISTPASLSFAVTGLRWSGTTLSMVMSPPVIAAATMKVPASMRSGIMVWFAGRSSFTPFILMVSVPAPFMSAPMEVRNVARSVISGSVAAFSMIVCPSASTAAIIVFSVAPTLGKSR